MTCEELAAIKARADAAKPGPWQPESEKLQILKEHAYSVRIRRADGLVLCDVWNWTDATHDVEFIAHARTDVPQLVAEVERLRNLVVVNWGDSPYAKVIGAHDQLRLIANSIRADGAVITAAKIEECAAVLRQYCDREHE